MKTIKEIYSYSPIEETDKSSSLELWFNKVIEKTENEIDVSDILRMIRQNLFLDLAIKKGVALLKENIAIGEYYDYELIEHLAKVDKKYLSKYEKDIDQFIKKINSLNLTDVNIENLMKQ